MGLAVGRFPLVLSAVAVGWGFAEPVRAQELFRNPEAETAYKQAVELLDAEKYVEALNEVNKALQIDPTYDVAYVVKGDALRGIKEHGAAALAYTKAIELDANSAAAYNGRGEAYLELEPVQVELALNDFRNALDLNRDDPKILANLGHISVVYLQDPVSGIRLLNEAIARDESNARSFRDRGLAQAMLKEFTKAEEDLKKATEVDPEDHDNFMTLANIYQFQEDYKSAVGALTDAIRAYEPEKLTDPKTYIGAYLLRADAWLAIGKEEEDKAARKEAFEKAVADADAVLDEYEDRFPESGYALFRRGIAQRHLGQYERSIDTLTQAIQIVRPGQDAPYLAEAYLRRGINWFYIGDVDLARGDFEQAASTGDGYRDPRVYLWIGYTYFKSDDLRTAIDYYAEAIAKDPEFTLAHVNRGLAYMKLGEYRKALASFNNAIRSEPSVGEHYYRSGQANMAMEKYQQAADMFSLAVLKDEKNPKYRKAAAEALRLAGKESLGDRWQREAEQLPTE